jgi:hypothetical protein
MRETLLTVGSVLLAGIVGGVLTSVAFGLFAGIAWVTAAWVVG